MQNFLIYLKLGLRHITDLTGYDHILFIVALCAIYELKDYRKIFYLVSFFTIGHSITLAWSVLKIININSKLIEFLIPVTILLTCLHNAYLQWFTVKNVSSTKLNTRYIIALVFGFIHGLGFSNFLRSLLGATNSIITELFSFNLGLEIGQLIIVVLFLIFSYLLIDILKLKKALLNYLVSFLAGCVSLYLIVNNLNLL